jgi:hypothetical protein
MKGWLSVLLADPDGTLPATRAARASHPAARVTRAGGPASRAEAVDWNLRVWGIAAAGVPPSAVG